MRHNEIEKGRSYAKVRPGRDREYLFSATKVTILDTEKRYAPASRWVRDDSVRFAEHEPGSPGAKGAEHMLARMEGRWTRPDGLIETEVEDPRVAVKPAELFMEWDAFLSRVAEKEEQEQRAKRAREEAARKHTLKWNAIADRLAPHAPESLIERIRQNASTGPYWRRATGRVDITLKELWALAVSIDPDPTVVCVTCFLPVDPETGDLFIGEDGYAYCNDHYREPVDA